MLQAAYTATRPATRDTHALTCLVSVASPAKNFVLFTTVTHRQEEMVIHSRPHLHPISGLLAFLSLTNGALIPVFALRGLPTRQRVVDPRRPSDPPSRLTLFRTSHKPATFLSPLSPSPPRRSKRSPSASTHPCPCLSLPSRVFLFLCYFRVTSPDQIPTGCNMIYTTSHLLMGDRHSH